MLATLCLNEMEWLPYSWEQHRSWPGMEKWVFVEAADRAYAESNPGMVSSKGLSVDGTSEYLKSLAERDSRIVYIPFGISNNEDIAKCKIACRQRYIDVADEISPEVVIVLDADEFYIHEHQTDLLRIMRRKSGYDAFVFHRREVWRPPSVAHQDLFSYEVVGGFWKIPCCHWWRYKRGMGYRSCHNTPDGPNGRPMNDRIYRQDENSIFPGMIHMGFASQKKTRVAKNTYYAARGEANDPQRRWYVNSRALWEEWTPKTPLIRDARVIPWVGPIPECFQSKPDGN